MGKRSYVTMPVFLDDKLAAADYLDAHPYHPLFYIMANTLTKRDLVNKISAETQLTQTEVFEVIQSAVDIISSALAAGDRVVIRNFGTFQVKQVKAKVGRNPKEPDKDVPIPARSVVKFKVGKELKEKVSEL